MNTGTTERVAAALSEVHWLHWQLWDNQVWRYLVFVGYVALAVLLAKLADVLLCRRFQAGKSGVPALVAPLVELLRGPLTLAVFIILLHLGVKPMNKPVWLQDYLEHIFGILVAVAITYALIKASDLGFELARRRFYQHDPRSQQQILLLLAKTARIFIILIAVLVTAENNGIKVGTVITSLGLGGLAAALAAQETLSNLLGSIVILADHPFYIGDRVKIDTFEGVVEHIGVRSTRLRMTTGDVITIPNRTVAGTAVINYTKPTPALAKPAATPAA